MVVLLFPSVTTLTASHICTAILIFSYKGTSLPVFAEFVAIVCEDVGFASEVLPIVVVHALCLVVLLVERAALSFEVEHIEIRIFLHLVDQSCLKLFCAVGK